MGIVSIFLVRNDALSVVEDDPGFGRKIAGAIGRGFPRKEVVIHAEVPNERRFCGSAALHIAQTHASDLMFVEVIGNTARALDGEEHRVVAEALKKHRDELRR